MPILIGGTIGTALTWQWASEQVESRARHFGNALANQLALTVTDPLLQDDVLSLNVILRDLVQRGDVAIASVYSADNHLVAQAGRHNETLFVESEDVTFQNTTAGYVQVGLASKDITAPIIGALGLSIALWSLIVVGVGVVVWWNADLVYLWLTASARRATPAASSDSDSEPAPPEPPLAAERTLLVIKIRPARQLDTHLDRIMQAIRLYGGAAEVTDGDDIVVTFERTDQLAKATCAAQLVATLMARARGNITVKSGMHACANDGDAVDIEQARKHATYLASIADGEVLASRRIFANSSENEHVNFEPFHSSLTPDGEVYVLAALSEASRKLIEKQAEKF